MTYPDSNDYLSNVTDDYRPPHVRHADRVVEMFKNEPVTFRDQVVEMFKNEPHTEMVAGRKVTFHEYDPDNPDQLQEIAFIVRRLRYGQMMELSAGIGVEAEVIHNWAQKMP